MKHFLSYENCWIKQWISPYILEIGHRHVVVQNEQYGGEGGGVVEDEEPRVEVPRSVNGAESSTKVSHMSLRDPRMSSSWYETTLNYLMIVERYPNLKEKVGGSIPHCEISSTW